MTEAMICTRTPEVIAAEINVIKAHAREVACKSAIEIGRRLYEAKSQLPHGKWGVWLEENVDYSVRTAQNLMAIYEEYGRNGNTQAIADLSYTQALILLDLDSETRAGLMESADFDSMSTRELRAEVDRLNAEISQRQVTIDQLMDQVGENAGMEAALAAGRELASMLQKDKEKAEKDAEKARQQAKDAVDRANNADAESKRLRSELQAEREKPAPLPVVERVEVVPEDVQRELETLRRKAAAPADEETIRFREAYRQLVEQFEYVEGLARAMIGTREEEARKYAGAVAAAARKMADRMAAL